MPPLMDSDHLHLLTGMQTKLQGLLKYVSYNELWSRIVHLATGLQAHALGATGDRIGILGFASLDFMVADYASLYLGAISAPLQSGAHRSVKHETLTISECSL